MQLAPEPCVVRRELTGARVKGVAIERLSLTNRNGIRLDAITYGGIITSLLVPDRFGAPGDIVLGFDDPIRYARDPLPPYFGALIGRYANRIARGRFTLDGREYALATNDPPNHLHGGVCGFDKRPWVAETRKVPGAETVKFTRISADGEEGYPGSVEVRVTYTLRDSNELVVEYRAITNAATPINLTQHTYFNLSAGASDDVLGHELMIDADRFTPIDETLIPTGACAPVTGTPFDFCEPTPIGRGIGANEGQLAHAGGYDHNWVLNHTGEGVARAARLRDPSSGRVLEIWTTEPGVQVYSGNRLDGSIVGKAGRRYGKHAGLCLETQHFPDSPNRPRFPSTILRPNEEYRSTSIYRFLVD
ncbi:MAG TPA: aldose epimerase family protein [Vicinamibacterales bacterium]|nr:aldose epimerase family protein [Vicinamibacterales bacterium]